MFKDAARTMLNQMPVVAGILRRRRMRRRFPTEMALLEGKSRPHSSHPSVLFFTQHKVASIYTREVCRALATDTGLILVDYDELMFAGEPTQGERDRIYNSPSPELYPAHGYCFVPIRSWNVSVPKLDPFRIILMLRDPRDVLVSLYYSMRSSHALPSVNNDARDFILAQREATAQMGIDDYVLERSDFVLHVCEFYIKHVLGKSNVLFITYEEMIADFENWLYRIVAHAGFTPQPSTIEKLVAESNFQVQSENSSRHIRQITPGDHRRKLQPETIAALTRRFAHVLERLGYSP